MNIDKLNEIELQKVYRNGEENIKNILIDKFMTMGDQDDVDLEFELMGNHLVESDNPKYQKYISELDRNDKTMIMKILINETKYSHSIITDLVKLIEVKEQTNKYYHDQGDLMDKVFQFWDFDELEVM
jgi:hypothetical protein